MVGPHSYIEGIESLVINGRGLVLVGTAIRARSAVCGGCLFWAAGICFVDIPGSNGDLLSGLYSIALKFRLYRYEIVDTVLVRSQIDIGFSIPLVHFLLPIFDRAKSLHETPPACYRCALHWTEMILFINDIARYLCIFNMHHLVVDPSIIC